MNPMRDTTWFGGILDTKLIILCSIQTCIVYFFSHFEVRRNLALFYAKEGIMYLFYMILYGKAESVFIVSHHVNTNK